MIDAEQTRKRLIAAHTLLLEPSTTHEKFISVRTLLEGINPKIDEALAGCDKLFSTFGKIESGDIVGLSADHLPENTEEQKRRKKYLLLFLANWNHLKKEVERVQAELAAAKETSAPQEKASHWSRIFRLAKGPFGLVTAIAVVAVVAAQATAVTIVVENKGCSTLYPSSSFPVSLPGLKLPKEPIKSGDSAEVVIPGFIVNVDGSARGTLNLKVLTFSLAFQLPGNIRDVTLNGTSLLGKQTQVHLSERDQHVLVLSCS